MDVLGLTKAACYELNEPAASTLVGSTDPNVLQLTYLLYAVGRDLVAAKYWSQLKRQATITTANADDKYALPTDFYAPCINTHFNQSETERLIGPISDAEWNELTYGTSTSSGRQHFRIFGRNDEQQIQIHPTPSSVQTLSYDYISNAWIRAIAGSTWATTITLDTDVVAFDDDIMILGLKAKIAKERGLEFQSNMAAYQRKLEQTAARLEGSYIGSMSGRRKRSKYNQQDGSWSF